MARPARLYSSVDLTGPFFTKDPAKTFRANARSMMRGLALEGEADIRAQLYMGEAGRAVISNKVRPARVREHVTAGIPFTPARAKTGAIRVHVYVPNFRFTPREGRALMAAYSRVERQTGAFARTTRRMRRAKAINVAELLKGLR